MKPDEMIARTYAKKCEQLLSENARLTRRCEAMTRAIRESVSSMQNTCAKWIPFTGCERFRSSQKIGCMPFLCGECDDWQFDEAQFAAKEDNPNE